VRPDRLTAAARRFCSPSAWASAEPCGVRSPGRRTVCPPVTGLSSGQVLQNGFSAGPAGSCGEVLAGPAGDPLKDTYQSKLVLYLGAW
jgi:hypothetical protein